MITEGNLPYGLGFYNVCFIHIIVNWIFQYNHIYQITNMLSIINV